MTKLDGMTHHHSIKEVEAALRANSGRPVLAAMELGLSRQALYDRINRSTALQAVIDEIDDRLVGKAVDNVTKAVEAGDLPMSRWLLERKGRHLGYGSQITAEIDAAAIEKLAQAIARGGIATCRAVVAALDRADG